MKFYLRAAAEAGLAAAAALSPLLVDFDFSLS